MAVGKLFISNMWRSRDSDQELILPDLISLLNASPAFDPVNPILDAASASVMIFVRRSAGIGLGEGGSPPSCSSGAGAAVAGESLSPPSTRLAHASTKPMSPTMNTSV